jgi:anthranilate phosphoribosyltransferase
VTYDEAKIGFERLFANQMDEHEAKDFLSDMYVRSESADQIKAATQVMRANSIKLPLSSELQEQIIDNCGTGGDKSGSFNISTTVSIVLASLGCFVAKHGNRSITSRSGSADMLESLGVKLNIAESAKRTMLEETGFVFLFAQSHHPAMKHIMPIRKLLTHRSIFNILGPLTNPADVKRHLIGVFDFDFAPKMVKVLQETGSRKGYIVCSEDGLDEVSVCAPTKALFFDGAHSQELLIEPTKYGIPRASMQELKGGEAKENAVITYELLKNGAKGAKKDIVAINAALALISADKARDIQDGIEMARYAIDSGKAFAKLDELIKVSNKL